jgi:hypothetical protein
LENASEQGGVIFPGVVAVTVHEENLYFAGGRGRVTGCNGQHGHHAEKEGEETEFHRVL